MAGIASHKAAARLRSKSSKLILSFDANSVQLFRASIEGRSREQCREFSVEGLSY